VFERFPAISRLIVFRTKSDNPEYGRNRDWLLKGKTGFWPVGKSQPFNGIALLIDALDGQAVEVWAGDRCERLLENADGRWTVGRNDAAPFVHVGNVGVGLNEFVGAQLSQQGFNYAARKEVQRRAPRRDDVEAGSATAISPEEANNDPFDPRNVKDARRKIVRSIAERRGQRAFRDALINAYGGKCAISGCSVLSVLEAAHIYPYLGEETNNMSNGLLLRADLHTLFDCGLLSIDARSLTIIVAPALRTSEYRALHGRKLRTPKKQLGAPSKLALAELRRVRRKDIAERARAR
jgi:hypothetical protein